MGSRIARRVCHFANLPIKLLMPTSLSNISEIALKTIPSASKIEIKRVLESLYGFEVEKVRTLNMDGKKKKRGGILMAKSDYKKAYVTLKNPLSISPDLYPIKIIEEEKRNVIKQAKAAKQKSSIVEDSEPKASHWLDDKKARTWLNDKQAKLSRFRPERWNTRDGARHRGDGDGGPPAKFPWSYTRFSSRFMTVMEMTNLSDLPHAMLTEIAKRLKKLEDYTSFRSVSRSLRAAAKKDYFEGLRLRQHTPYMMLPVRDGNDEIRELYSLVENESIVASVKVPNFKRKKCLESLGWLLVSEVDGSCSLLDPFSGTEIPLPHQSTFPEYDRYEMEGDIFFEKMVLSSKPNETSDFVLMVIGGCIRELAFWRLGDEAGQDQSSHQQANKCNIRDLLLELVEKQQQTEYDPAM